MYTLLLVSALLAAPGETLAPSWQTYSQASQMAGTEKKPMAVFLGTGEKGWEQVAGSLNSEAEKILTASYVCAYVDTNTPAGKSLAQSFEIKNGVGLVLSDRTGNKQVFWHEGNLPQTQLVRQLVRFSTSTRTSMYPAEESLTGTSAILNGSSYCPSCNAGSSRRR